MVFTETNGAPQPEPQLEPDDDISLILRHLLHRSSSTSSTPPPAPTMTSMFPASPPPPVQFGGSAVFSASDRVSVNVDTNHSYFPVTAPHMTTTTTFDDDDCDCDYESEEAAAGDTKQQQQQQPQSQSRNHSKRSRAAEIHNLSEKRRRSRINEKMKALQNLIPNSNKTDKASMLDEAIEYLKQLQLQVQMLSIRNGMSLHPMCLPGVAGIVHPAQISQMGMDLGGQRGRSLDVNTRNAFDMTSNTPDTLFNLPKQCALPGTGRPPSSTMIHSEAASFGLESCILPNFGSFELRDQAVCGEPNLHENHFIGNNTETNTLVTGALLLSENQESDVKGYNPTEGLTSH